MAGTIEAQAPAPDLRELLASFVDVVQVTNEIELAKWQDMDADQMRYFCAGARVNLVLKAEERYPGHLYSFTEPRVDEQARLGLSRDSLLARKIRVAFHAFVFAPVAVQQLAAPEDRAGFLKWAWTALRTFRRDDPMEALADAWATGFRPKEGEPRV